MEPQETQAVTQSVPRWLLILFGLAALALAAALLVYAYGRFGGATNAPLESLPAFGGTAESGLAPVGINSDELLEVGDAAPDFELPTVDGETMSLGDYAGRPVILNFWATWCAPCRLEMPELQRAQAEFDAVGEAGPVVLTINQDESAEQVTAFFDEVGLTLPALLDDNGEVGLAYGAYFLPTSVIVGPDGVVSAIHRGMISRDELEGYLGDSATGGS
jgi:peroxiredoxin